MHARVYVSKKYTFTLYYLYVILLLLLYNNKMRQKSIFRLSLLYATDVYDAPQKIIPNVILSP